MQGAQKLRSEAHLRVRRNDEVAAQRSRWTFYETIIFGLFIIIMNQHEALDNLADQPFRNSEKGRRP
jgi:hypothetical protein